MENKHKLCIEIWFGEDGMKESKVYWNLVWWRWNGRIKSYFNLFKLVQVVVVLEQNIPC